MVKYAKISWFDNSMPVLSLKLDGLVCASCLGSVRDAILAQVPAVKDTLYLNYTKALLQAPADKHDDIVKAIEDRGFDCEVDTSQSITMLDPDALFPEEHQKAPPSGHYFKKALIALGIGIPLMIVGLLGVIPSPLMPLGRIIGIVLSVFTYLTVGYLARDFFKSAFYEIKGARPGMDTLFAMGSTTAFIFSLLVVAMPSTFAVLGAHTHFAAVFMITGIVCLGRGIKNYLSARASKKRKDTPSAQSLFLKWQPLHVLREDEAGRHSVAFYTVQPGDRVRVQSSDPRLGVDGVYQGKKPVAVSNPASGETVPYWIQPGDNVLAGMCFHLPEGVTDVPVMATEHGAQTKLYRLFEEVVKNNYNKTTAEYPLVKKISKWFVPLIVGLATLSAILWGVLAPVSSAAYALMSFCAVLLCACPCALGLASPLSTLIGGLRATREGIYIKRADAMERAGELTTIVFDKTGTLTSDIPNVVAQDVYLNHGNVAQFWGDIVAIESKVPSHPVGRALRQFAAQQPGFISPEQSCEKFQVHDGYISASIAGRVYHIGQRDKLQPFMATTNPPAEKAYTQALKAHYSPNCVLCDGQWVSVLPLETSLKPGAKAAIAWLKSQGYRLKMLTGDVPEVAQNVAQAVGLLDEKTDPADIVIAGQSPEQKKSYLSALQAQGQKVAMVGDGINDLKAMQLKNVVSVAVSDGVDASLEADVVLADGDLGKFKKFLIIAKRTRRNIKQNLGLAFIYNTVSILVAAGLLFPLFGFLGNPIVASVGMGISSILVIMNAVRLNGVLNRDLQTPPKTMWQELKDRWHSAPRWARGLTISSSLFLAAATGGTICGLLHGISFSALFTASGIGMMSTFCASLMLTGYVGLGIVAAILIGFCIYKGVNHYKGSQRHKKDSAMSGGSLPYAGQSGGRVEPLLARHLSVVHDMAPLSGAGTMPSASRRASV